MVQLTVYAPGTLALQYLRQDGGTAAMSAVTLPTADVSFWFDISYIADAD